MIAFLLLSLISIVSCNTDYDKQSSWGESCNSGLASERKQSPIDFKDDQLTDRTFDPIAFSKEASEPLITNGTILTNNGDSVTVTNDKFSRIKVSGGGFSEEYRVLGPHFHWGRNDNEGSEHLVNGQAYPLEMHAVSIKSKFDNVNEALRSGEKDALAVLGVLFEIQQDGVSPLSANFVKSVEDLSKKKTNERVNTRMAASFRDLFPENMDGFYRYEGSLTTPGCNEQVVWTVFKDKLHVPKDLLHHLRQMASEMGGSIEKNFRSTQSINDRTIYSSSGSVMENESDDVDAATKSVPTTHLLFATAGATWALRP